MKLDIHGNRRTGYRGHGQYEPGVDHTPKPCPFCGGVKVEVWNTHTPYYWAQCEGCGAEIGGSYKPSREHFQSRESARRAHVRAFRSAMEAWNTRTAAEEERA